MLKLLLLLVVCDISTIHSLDNGLALTPPMGWSHWERFRCNIDCDKYPKDCISENLFKEMADRMFADGFLAAGYEYVIMEDCWLAMQRDHYGQLQADPKRFPSGIQALADYIHAKGLKFGIYENYGPNTCEGFPGSLDSLEIDAHTFADWGVDYLKFDGCNTTVSEEMEQGHMKMGKYLNETGRPIVFSCEFPLYRGSNANYNVAVQACNLWRNQEDVQDSWSSVSNIIESYKNDQDTLIPLAGPGHWNDPDALIIGNFGLSLEQSKAQMTVWSILAAPLIMSNDLRNIRPEFKDILLNDIAIKINQDPLGKQGHLYKSVNSVDIWKKYLSPKADDNYSFGLGFVNNRDDGTPYRLKLTLQSLGLKNDAGYMLTDAFSYECPRLVHITETLEVHINPTGAVLWHLEAMTVCIQRR